MRAQRKTIKAPGILAEKTHAQCVAGLLLDHSFHFGYLHPSSLPCPVVEERVSTFIFISHQSSCVGVRCLHIIHAKKPLKPRPLYPSPLVPTARDQGAPSQPGSWIHCFRATNSIVGILSSTSCHRLCLDISMSNRIGGGEEAQYN